MESEYHYKYRIFSRQTWYEETMTEQFGIACFDQNGTMIQAIEDIDIEYSAVEQLKELLNREKVFPNHFMDVVEDFLVG